MLARSTVMRSTSAPAYRALTRYLSPAWMLLFLLVFAPLVTVFAAWDKPGLVDIREVLNGQLSPAVEVRTFEQSERLYPSALVRRGSEVRPLQEAQGTMPSLHITSQGGSFDLPMYLSDDRVAGLLILKNDRVVLERYRQGFGPTQRWASWSMAKSVSSVLIGAALQQGLIHSLDDAVTRYVPALRGSPYAQVSIRDVLRMSSGVGWSETYTDPRSDCRRLADLQLLHRPGASMGFMAGLKRVGAPGSVWNYNSGEANIPGAILEAATHMPLAAYLSKTLWVPLGMEHDATWWTEAPGGLGLSGVGLGATLRDYARFGLFVEHDGVLHGRRILPPDFLAEATSPQSIGGRMVSYGYLWWPIPSGDPVEQGAFEAKGIFGQHLYINPHEHLVIVVLSARAEPVGTPAIRDTDFFTAVAHALPNIGHGPARSATSSH